MGLNTQIHFRADKELLDLLEQGKKRMGIAADADYIRMLIRSAEINCSLMNMNRNFSKLFEEIQQIKAKIEPTSIASAKPCIPSGLQPLNKILRPKRIKRLIELNGQIRG